ARITGIGSNLLTIHGVEELYGTEHTISPDIIEIGSFIGLAAMTASDLEITGIDVGALGNIPDTFQRIGVQMEARKDSLMVYGSEPYEIQKFIDGSIL